jgi:hypothetical protein
MCLDILLLEYHSRQQRTESCCLAQLLEGWFADDWHSLAHSVGRRSLAELKTAVDTIRAAALN